MRRLFYCQIKIGSIEKILISLFCLDFLERETVSSKMYFLFLFQRENQKSPQFTFKESLLDFAIFMRANYTCTLLHLILESIHAVNMASLSIYFTDINVSLFFKYEWY